MIDFIFLVTLRFVKSEGTIFSPPRAENRFIMSVREMIAPVVPGGCDSR